MRRALMGDKKKKAGDDKSLKRRVRELEAQAQVDTALVSDRPGG